jgi:hypothetical protein
LRQGELGRQVQEFLAAWATKSVESGEAHDQATR